MFNLSRLFKSVPETLAAVDLGSNSFHMIIAHWQNDAPVVIDRIKEPVRLGFGLRDDGSLSDEAVQRAMECLQRFGERLRSVNAGSVRIVGTKTLRSINNASEFLTEAQARLGHPVEIISGEEEARLIYLGVAQAIEPGKDRRIVMDIGGGSTEVIIGRGMDPEIKESLNMGCVALTKRFFDDGKISRKAIKKARVACLQELEPVRDDLLDLGWSECIGASGSIKAVAEVCTELGWTTGEIHRQNIADLIDQFVEHGNIDLSMKGLSADRQPVFFGGLIVLSALFESLQLETIAASDWALREGLLFDLKGRFEHKDIRDESINKLVARYHVVSPRVGQIEKTVEDFLPQVTEDWALNPEESLQLLKWAARIFLIGLDITHSDYHKHGAYIAEHVDLAGFSRSEQAQLSALVLSHRKRFPVKKFPMDNEPLLRLSIIFRLAVIFNRARRNIPLPEIKLVAKGKQLSLNVATEWLENNSLTLADLENEVRYLNQIGYSLLLNDSVEAST
ncbi:exopolyphosphatase [Gynuella sp.]|uniref:exopolyphosphatase n=1 Tax=Gynuella sp. TaxID=2969146 RepID=UPI003D151C8A